MEPSFDDLGVGDIHTSDAPPVDPADRLLSIPPAQRPPTNFGDYIIGDRLGRGAFGEVFKVWSQRKCRYEAMKVLRDVVDPGDERLDAFRYEVQRMANVRSPHVVHVYHVDVTPDGRPFFTMEYSGGGRLDEYCDRQCKSIEDRIRAVADICDAVQHMHELNLVHCDIKPGNIVVSEEAGVMTPKLVDFGLASHLAFHRSPDRGARGTLPYMAPEQLDSHGGDPEKGWDIYALGVTLYRLIVGECPIERFPDPTTSFSVLADHVRKTPIPPLAEKLTGTSSQHYSEVARQRRLDAPTLVQRLRDPWLEAVVDKALAKPAHERYSSAAEMAANLRQYAAGRRPPIVRPTVRDRIREFLRDRGVAAALVALLTIALVLAGWTYRARATARRATVDRLFAEGCGATDPLTAMARFEEGLRLSPGRSDLRLHLASAFLARGDARGAVLAARGVLEGDRRYPWAQAFIHGIEHARRGSASTADPAAFAIDATSPEAAYYASLTLGPDQAERALTLLDLALADPLLTHDAGFRIRLLRAARLVQLRDWSALKLEIRQMGAIAQRSATVWNLQAIADWKMGKWDEAAEAFRKALDLNPEFVAALRNRADLRNERHHYAAALRDCTRAVELAPAVRPLIEHARVTALIGTGDLPTARAACDGLLATDAATAGHHLACGTLWTTTGDPERAWREFDVAYSRLQGTGSEMEYLALRQRGVAANECRRFSDAIDDLNGAAALLPDRWRDNGEGPLLRGLVYLQANEIDHAIVDFVEAVRLRQKDPENPVRHLWLWDLYQMRGETSLAAASLRAASAAGKSDLRIGRIVGHCRGDVTAEALLREAGDEPVRRAEALYYIGLAAKHQGQLEEAIAAFRACQATEGPGLVERRLAEWQLGVLEEPP